MSRGEAAGILNSWIFQLPAVVSALNRLLSDCGRLEYLRVYNIGLQDERGGLKLPPHLRCLVLREMVDVRPMLSEANCLVLASSLRALRLNRSHSHYYPSPPIPIAAFVNLTYLGIKVDGINGASFLVALDSLRSLKALELRLADAREYRGLRTSAALDIIASFPSHCTPHLEHLTINAKGHESLYAKQLRAVGRHLPALRSLAVIGGSRMEGGWDWLRTILRRGRLEYLLIDGYYVGDCLEVPVQIPAMAIRHCRVGE